MVLTASFVLSPAIGLSCHRHPRFGRELDAGVEASGPHDFAVRVSTIRQTAPSASTASPAALMTLANAPLWLETARVSATDLPDGASGIFLQRGLDGQMTDLPVGQSLRSCEAAGGHLPVIPGRNNVANPE